ncbi:MAG: polysaccharide deacetylase family protein, partial [Phascolarctobacterium sp.]|nr:polysaccharide deacetylase family protein [Phascolarctobacterium sp.]
MLKKLAKFLFSILLAFIIVFGGFWMFFGDLVKEEYAAYRKSSAPILLYHAVGEPVEIEWPPSLILPASLFEAHLQYLTQEGYKVVSVEELVSLLQNGGDLDKVIAMSFDDGYRNNHTDALPLLKKYNAKASFYVVHRDIGKTIYMDNDRLLDLLANGMEIGSHTINHAPLALIDPKYLPWEVGSAKKFIEKNLDGYNLKGIAYPNGGYNAKVIEAVKEYKFTYGLSGKVGANTHQSFQKAPYELQRISIVDDGNGLEGFKRRLERAYLWGFL